jgi:predicted amidophosphoribosyltransferase
MAEFLRKDQTTTDRTDVIIPMPSSKTRTVQPVVEIARELGKRLKKPVLASGIRKVRETPGLKDVYDREERRELLEGAFEVRKGQVKGKGILLVDDLYRSGATANSVTLALMGGGAARVYFVAATRTRAKG